MEDLRYPIGKWTRQVPGSDGERRQLIAHISATPPRMREAVTGLNDAQLDTPYRPGGWTVRQVVHHVPDSHMNAYIRLKLALTEDNPLIKTYEESLWAQLADARAPIEDSLVLLERLHRRWDLLLGSMAPADFARPFRHPELGAMSIDELISLYAWHGRHHVAHV